MMVNPLPTCALCHSHATVDYHSTYRGHNIAVAYSWVTGTKHYHSDIAQGDTLVEIRGKIKEHDANT